MDEARSLGHRLCLGQPSLVSIDGMEKGWAELGQAIRARRRAAGLSQEELAERSGTHWTYISEIENNWRNPSIALVRRIATGLGIPLSQLVADAEAEKAEEVIEG